MILHVGGETTALIGMSVIVERLGVSKFRRCLLLRRATLDWRNRPQVVWTQRPSRPDWKKR